MGVEQSGPATRGHLARFATDGVVEDAGANPYSERVLASLLNADFNSTEDQAIVLPELLQVFQLTRIIVAGASISLTTAVGGFYPQIEKAGSPIVLASQVYTALTTGLLLLNPTLTSYGSTNAFSRTQLPDWAVYFSLTTGQGALATGNIYLCGIEML